MNSKLAKGGKEGARRGRKLEVSPCFVCVCLVSL